MHVCGRVEHNEVLSFVIEVIHSDETALSGTGVFEIGIIISTSRSCFCSASLRHRHVCKKRFLKRLTTRLEAFDIRINSHTETRNRLMKNSFGNVSL